MKKYGMETSASKSASKHSGRRTTSPIRRKNGKKSQRHHGTWSSQSGSLSASFVLDGFTKVQASGDELILILFSMAEI